MQGYPGMNMNMNRAGLGMRPPIPSYGQGPSMMALAQGRQQQQAPHMGPPRGAAENSEGTTIFIGSIAGGITDDFMKQLLSVSPFALFSRSYHAEP